MNSGKPHRVQFAHVDDSKEEEDHQERDPDTMYSTWSLWTSFLRNVNRASSDSAVASEAEPEAKAETFSDFYTAPEKISRVNFSDSPKVEEMVLPLDWAEYLIFKERMHRRRSTGSHIIRGIQRIRIKRLRSDNLKPIGQGFEAPCGRKFKNLDNLKILHPSA